MKTSDTIDGDSTVFVAHTRRLLVASRVLSAILGIIACAAIAAFLLGFVCVRIADSHPKLGKNFCFPLSQPTDVISGKNGRIFVALAFYGRIQVYDALGRFEYGYLVESDGGLVRLEFDKAGNVVVVPARTEMIHVYSKNGRHIRSKRKAPRAKRPPWKNRTVPFKDSRGHKYYIVNRAWNPRIVREKPAGEQKVLIQTPIPLRPFVGPLPCWAVAMSAVLIQIAIRWCCKNLTSEGIGSPGLPVDGKPSNVASSDM